MGIEKNSEMLINQDLARRERAKEVKAQKEAESQKSRGSASRKETQRGEGGKGKQPPLDEENDELSSRRSSLKGNVRTMELMLSSLGLYPRHSQQKY